MLQSLLLQIHPCAQKVLPNQRLRGRTGFACLFLLIRYDNPDIYLLLEEYKKLSGIPLLCNTSANYSGKGFFPDILSVIEWGYVDFIWNEGKLYFKRDKLNELAILIN